MPKKFLLLVLIFIISLQILYAEKSKATSNAKEIYFRFNISEKSELNKLTKVVSIDYVKHNRVKAYATPQQLKKLKNLGYKVTILPPPGKLIKPRMAKSLAELRDWDYYPTYDQYVQMMWDFEADYPELCEIENIGQSVEGRDILFVKISDNVDVQENEPEFMFTATMHGDELAGYVLMLRLIDYLLSNYESNPEVTNLVNNIEIWINPLANPDGTYHGGNNSVWEAQRFNANYVDLNRNFPDPEDGPHPDGNEWQPETIAMMDLAEEHTYVHSANFHGGAEVINYPWDTWNNLPADDEWYIDISKAYADTVFANSTGSYFTGISNTGYIRGYVWYSINGGRQDYMNYFQACREVTIELSNVKMLPENELQAHWITTGVHS